MGPTEIDPSASNWTQSRFYLSARTKLRKMYGNNKRTVCEPSQFGSNREHIAAALALYYYYYYLALYMCNAAAAARASVEQEASNVVVEDIIFGRVLS